MRALAGATREVLAAAGIDGQSIAAIALDTTGSSVIPVGENLEPLDDYYLWCDHRAHAEAEQITAPRPSNSDFEGNRVVRRRLLARMGLRQAPALAAPQPRQARPIRHRSRTLRHGSRHPLRHHRPHRVKRSICAMGHKWMWNPKWDGLPPRILPVAVDPLFAGVRDKLGRRLPHLDHLAGHLSPQWAAELGLRAGIPIPVGAFDAHWDAIGANMPRGRCRQRRRHLHLHHRHGEDKPSSSPASAASSPAASIRSYTGIEAGLSATGDIFDAIARRASTTVAELVRGSRILSAPARPASSA